MDYIDLHELMKKADKNGITMIEKEVLVGEEDRLPLRLVAIKNPENIAQQRKRPTKLSYLDSKFR